MLQVASIISFFCSERRRMTYKMCITIAPRSNDWSYGRRHAIVICCRRLVARMFQELKIITTRRYEKKDETEESLSLHGSRCCVCTVKVDNNEEVVKVKTCLCSKSERKHFSVFAKYNIDSFIFLLKKRWL